MRVYNITRNKHKYSIICMTRSSNGGFIHECTMLEDGSVIRFTRSEEHHKRVWESYPYETVMNKTIRCCGVFSEQEINSVVNEIKAKNRLGVHSDLD